MKSPMNKWNSNCFPESKWKDLSHLYSSQGHYFQFISNFPIFSCLCYDHEFFKFPDWSMCYYFELFQNSTRIPVPVTTLKSKSFQIYYICYSIPVTMSTSIFQKSTLPCQLVLFLKLVWHLRFLFQLLSLIYF